MENINKSDFFNNKEKVLVGHEEENISEIIENKQTIINIELDKLLDFKRGQPFSMYDEGKMQEMKKSIIQRGVLQPIIIRQIENNKYEIIAGHNRVKCSREVELKTIPAHIVECDDEEATLIMLETNLCTRENITILEKSYAYKLQLETLKKIKEKDPVGHERSVEQLADNAEDSITQIKRYIRLTSLIKDLQDKVNRNEISIRAGVELSYINEEEQEIVHSVIVDEKVKISLVQAEKLKQLNGELTYQTILDILKGNKVITKTFTGKIEKRAFDKYRDKFQDDIEFTNLVVDLLEKYYKNDEGNSNEV